MESIFVLPKDEYKSTLDPIKGYLNQLAFYISTKKNIPIQQATEVAKKIIKDNIKDKPIKYFSRQENGDRKIEDSTLLNYIITNIKNKNILVPTFTAYLNSNVKKSILSEFIFINVKKRGIAKKIAQKAKAENNTELHISKNNEQNMMKGYNNSMSGAFAQEACILHNPTAHNTLTSVTRTLSSLANANNEKIISGNRYYPRGIDILNNIVYITSNIDINEIKNITEKYNIHLPTVEETVSVLKYSSDLYFVDNKYYTEHIIPFLINLTPYHLAAICYISDLYHLRKYNDTLIRTIIDEIITPIIQEDTSEDIPNKIHSINDNILNFVHQIFFSKLKGYGKDYDKMHKDGLASNIYYTGLHINDVLVKYKDFFKCFFITNIMPNNSNKLKYMRRRTVVLSDTDSTCYTLDEWVKWYHGSFNINDKTIAVASCISYITTETIINLLAILSSNLNVSKEDLHTLAMKNEYVWTIFNPAEVSKHYMAYTVMQEGNVFSEPDLELKGVHLKSSAVPKFIINDSKELIKEILKTVHENRKIRIVDVINKIKGVEASISESIIKGESIYLKKSKIKNKEAYALGDHEFLSPFQRHTFWVQVFAQKYGDVPEPPYDAIKIPTTVITRTTLKEWLDKIEDNELKIKLNSWLVSHNKSNLPTIYLNEQYILGNGIPKEIISVIDIKRIILDVTMQYRVILETLGIMLMDGYTVSEQF